MQATVYANLTTRRLTTTLGGSAISFPAFVQGDKVRIGLRFAESLEGSPIEVQRIVTHIRQTSHSSPAARFPHPQATGIIQCHPQRFRRLLRMKNRRWRTPVRWLHRSQFP
jgi:hypothetical protein